MDETAHFSSHVCILEWHVYDCVVLETGNLFTSVLICKSGVFFFLKIENNNNNIVLQERQFFFSIE